MFTGLKPLEKAHSKSDSLVEISETAWRGMNAFLIALNGVLVTSNGLGVPESEGTHVLFNPPNNS
jgi:hypothetical protein